MRRLAHSVRRSDRKLESEDVNGLPYVGLENVESWTGSILPVDLPAMSDGLVNSFSRGNVLFGKLRPYLAKAFSADFDGICSGEFLVLDPIDYDRRFLLHVLLAEGFVSLVDSSTYGAKMPRANWDFVGESLLPVPPLDEQRAIAAFLDRETERIDALVEKKRLLIERLEEYRTALITRTVTRGLPPEAARAAGLDPTPRLKASGVDWLGDVPEHWEVLRLDGRYEIKLGKMLNEARITGEYLVPYLRNVDVQWDRININALPQMDVRPSELDRYSIRAGDILVCEGGEPGRAAIVPEIENGKFAFQKALHRLRPRAGECPRFLYYTLYFAAELGVFFAGANPNTILHLTGQMLSRYRLPRPPVAEQIAIVDFLDRTIGHVDRLAERDQDFIERLQEYRTALITAAVTGKIDVREAAQAPVAAMLA